MVHVILCRFSSDHLLDNEDRNRSNRNITKRIKQRLCHTYPRSMSKERTKTRIDYSSNHPPNQHQTKPSNSKAITRDRISKHQPRHLRITAINNPFQTEITHVSASLLEPEPTSKHQEGTMNEYLLVLCFLFDRSGRRRKSMQPSLYWSV